MVVSLTVLVTVVTLLAVIGCRALSQSWRATGASIDQILASIDSGGDAAVTAPRTHVGRLG